jgi:hypothetical protein
MVLLVQSPEQSHLLVRGRTDIEVLERDEYIRFSKLALVAFSSFLRSSKTAARWISATMADTDPKQTCDRKVIR